MPRRHPDTAPLFFTPARSSRLQETADFLDEVFAAIARLSTAFSRDCHEWGWPYDNAAAWPANFATIQVFAGKIESKGQQNFKAYYNSLRTVAHT
jgi:hypothetical protein